MVAGNTRSAISSETRDRSLTGVPGGLILRLSAVALIAAVVLCGLAVRSAVHGGGGGLRLGLWIGTAALLAAGGTGLRGLTTLAPGDAVVLQRLGVYVGTLSVPGLWWIIPWAKRQRLSTKVRTHETATLKVNDMNGLPVEVAMVVIWRVSDSARALFLVEDYVAFTKSQCEMALRTIVSSRRYEPEEEGARSLSTSAAAIGVELVNEVARRVEPAGITILESQVVRLAYAPEIAQAMLRRQQAAAIVAARQHIVDGAVGMVELALERLEEEHVVELDEERKATMVSNLLVVLCSDHGTQPMVNAGSLYL